MDNNNAPNISQLLYEKKLEDEIQELKNRLNEKEKTKKDEITLAQQLLLLHYLGLLKAIDLNTKAKSLLLSKILNKSYDNIRNNLTYINAHKISESKIRNVENLQVVLRIFDELKMTEASERVKLDLKKHNRL